jgi:hypothetical protein
MSPNAISAALPAGAGADAPPAAVPPVNVTTGPWPVAEIDAVRRKVSPIIQRFVEPGRDGRVWLRSPWGFQVPLVTPTLVSEDAHRRFQLSDEAFRAGDAAGALCHVERPYRFAVLEIQAALGRLTREQIAEGVLFTWSSLYLVYPVAAEGLRLLRRTGFVADLGDGGERVVTARPAWMTGELVVYRGVSDPAHVGPSWTRDVEVAREHAHLYPGRPTLLTGVVRAADVLAYLDRDDTVVAIPRRVRITAVDPT